jgi:hypothetical protein
LKQDTVKVIDGFLNIDQMLHDLINSGKEDRIALLRDFILMLPPETERDYEVYLTKA